MTTEAQFAHIQRIVLDFLGVVAGCHESTAYADDRRIYADDAVLILRAFSDFRRERNIEDFQSAIAKEFTRRVSNLWRRGSVGEQFERAFATFSDEIADV